MASSHVLLSVMGSLFYLEIYRNSLQAFRK